MAWAKIKTKFRKPLGWWYHKIMCDIAWSFRYKFDFGFNRYYHHLDKMVKVYKINLYGELIIDNQNIQKMEKTLLTEENLIELGFAFVVNDSYINKKQWLLLVSNDFVDIENGKMINRDGTWFDAIGTWGFRDNGAMGVNTLCRGNYVCRVVYTVEDLQLLYLGLTGKKLEQKIP